MVVFSNAEKGVDLMSLTYTIGTSEYGLNILLINYGNEPEIELDLTDIYKDQSFLPNLYVQINEYVATLPDYTQKEIYDIFYKVYSNDYKQNYNDINYVNKLENKIARVSELLNYNNFKLWLSHKESQMIIPENIRDEYIYDPDMNTTVEKTYVRHEYRDLISLIIFIRAISPLYIDFYNYIKQITNHYYYKIFMLFIRSDIYTSPEIEKLKQYIEVNQQTLIGNTKNEHLIISAGLADDDILDSLVSEIIFNKLLTIDFFNKKCNIISFIFQTIKYKGNFVTSDSVLIRSKTTVNDPNKEDISYFEDYRKTSDVPLGTKVEIQHALSNTKLLVKSLGYSNFDYDLYNKELNNINAIHEKGIDKIQIYILGWFLNKVINPRALFYIEEIKVIELMLLAKVALLQSNHKFIAMLLSSYKTVEGNYVNIIIRNSLNKNLIKKLNDHYSFTIDEDKQSPIEKTITEVSREIVNSLWIPIGSEEQLAGIVNKEGYLDIPNNINDIVCNFIDFINSPTTV